MSGRPCPLCGRWYCGTATQPAACEICVVIARFMSKPDPPKPDFPPLRPVNPQPPVQTPPPPWPKK